LSGELARGSVHGQPVVLLGAQSSGKLVDVFRVRPPAEATKKLKRRLKRLREKAAARAGGDGSVEGDDDLDDDDARAPGGNACEDTIASDELELAGTLRSAAKLISFAFLPSPLARKGAGGAAVAAGVRLLLSLQTNSLEVVTPVNNT
jgi:hypothetical protein